MGASIGARRGGRPGREWPGRRRCRIAAIASPSYTTGPSAPARPAPSSGTTAVTTPRSAQRARSSSGIGSRTGGDDGVEAAEREARAAENGTAAVVGRQPVEQRSPLGAAAGEDRRANPDRGGRQVLRFGLEDQGRAGEQRPGEQDAPGGSVRAVRSATKTSRPAARRDRGGEVCRGGDQLGLPDLAAGSDADAADAADDHWARVAGRGGRSGARPGDLAVPGRPAAPRPGDGRPRTFRSPGSPPPAAGDPPAPAENRQRAAAEAGGGRRQSPPVQVGRQRRRRQAGRLEGEVERDGVRSEG